MKWIFSDNTVKREFSTFPYAFRAMHAHVEDALKNGKIITEVTKHLKITSPVKTIHGDLRVYSYYSAREMAKNQGLLTPEGKINQKEFKRSR